MPAPACAPWSLGNSIGSRGKGPGPSPARVAAPARTAARRKLEFRKIQPNMTRRNSALCAALILVLRLAIAGQYRGNFDSASYRIAAAAVLSGQNVYAATDRYNYSPAWSYFVAGLWKLAAPNASLFILLIGLSLIVVDAMTALLLARLASRRLGFPEDEARRAALLFFSNPISVLLSCAHGQFDSLSILLLLAAIFA